MRYFKGSAGFAIGGLVIVATLMAIEVYVRGYTYRNTPPLGNLIFGVIIFMPYVLSASIGFAVGLHIFRVAPAFASSVVLGAGFVSAVGLFYWALNLKPFNHSMIAHGALLFGMAIPSALLVRTIRRSRLDAPTS